MKCPSAPGPAPLLGTTLDALAEAERRGERVHPFLGLVATFFAAFHDVVCEAVYRRCQTTALVDAASQSVCAPSPHLECPRP